MVRHRPPRQVPREWWRYAARCVMLDINDHQLRTARGVLDSRFMERLSSWQRYVSLYMRRSGATWLPALEHADQTSLLEIEDLLSVAEIIMCRTRADANLAWQRAKLLERSESSRAVLKSPLAHAGRPIEKTAVPRVERPREAREASIAGARVVGHVHVSVHEARGLRSVCSSYVVIYCDDDYGHSRTVVKSAAPAWEEAFDLPVHNDDATMHVLLFEEARAPARCPCAARTGHQAPHTLAGALRLGHVRRPRVRPSQRADP